MGERAWMGDLFYLGDARSTMYLDTGVCRPWRLPFISVVRMPLSCALFRFVARKLRFRHDYRTAFTFIHANTAHIYPYFLVMHFVSYIIIGSGVLIFPTETNPEDKP